MFRYANRILLGLAAAFAPVSIANAAELSTVSSSGTMTISVYIPPISSALRAQATGAVGLWTIEGQFDGMMVQLGRPAGDGNDTAGEAASPLTLYTRPGNMVGVSMNGADWNAASLVVPQSSGEDAGLVRSTYAVPQAESGQVVTIVGL